MKQGSALIAALLLVACANKDSAVRVTTDEKPVAAAPAPNAVARSEPVFYNGKTYQLKFTSPDGGVYAMTVSGMTANQKKDAVAVATSSLRYFTCRDEQKSVVTAGPSYVGSVWQLSAKCV
jgi:hypothetical protein